MNKPKFTFLAILLAFFAATAWGQSVATINEFNAGVTAYATATEDVEIVVEQDLTLTSLVNIPANVRGATLTIRSANSDKAITLKRDRAGNLFTVPTNATLILENIIVDGAKASGFANGNGSLVRVSGGAFVMNAGAVLRDNVFSNSPGGGVYVNSGAFKMNGGSISGNTASDGGGVYVSIYGTLSNSSTFTMNGGEISGNTASSSGGGVYVNNSGTFTMTGGSISGNTASSSGGGVYVNNSGTFTMTGGSISGNTARDGGGVCNSGAFTMNEGSISGNTGNLYGGGVYNSVTFTMNGGEINGNSGGGVYVYYGTFTMNGGSISENTASNGGGGVHVRNPSTFTMNGGVVVGTGTSATSIVFGNYNINKGIIVAWDKPASAGPFVYTEGTSLTAYPTERATAVWAINDGKFGISYKNGDNEGFVEIPDLKIITEDYIKVSAGTSAEFYEQVSVYAKMGVNLIVEVSQDLTLNQLVNIPTPAMAGKTLTIRSANSDKAVTLKRGIVGNLFTVPTNATLILEDIIIDGAKASGFANGNGSLVMVSGAFVMNAGAVLRDNVFSNSSGGGVYVYDSGIFTMNGGVISGNTASSGSGIYRGSGTVNLNGGVAVGVSGAYSLNGTPQGPNNGIVIAWDKPASAVPFVYTEGTSLTAYPTESATAVWAINDGKFGISYKNGDNEGFVEIPDLKVITEDYIKVSVGTSAEFYEQVSVYAKMGVNLIVEVSQDLTLNQLINIPVPAMAGKTLTICSVNSNKAATLKRGIVGDLFAVPTNATLILENIIVDGAKASGFANGNGSLVIVSGAFVMNAGAVLRDNLFSNNSGGGVYVSGSSSTFTMNGGSISGNTASGSGGGVYVNSGTFTMNGGSISGNTAYFGGGGVYVNSGTFTMSGGSISGNTASNGGNASNGGGVYVSGSSSTFTMNGGSISDNTASNASNGGGVYNSGTFTMNGGTISGNTGSLYGGGVGGGVYNSGTFTMNGGTISGNTGGLYCGGVYNSGIFTMNGGSISGNTAANAGGRGVYNSGTFTMNGGVAVGVSGAYSLNGSPQGPNNGIVVAWDKPASAVPFVYTEGTSLTAYPTESATAVWAINDGKFGISYKNGDNEGFVEIPDLKVITEDYIKVSAGTSAEFYEQVSVYAKMGVNLIVEVSQDLTLNQLINIPTPAMAGKTLTIRSVNSDKAVTLKRGIVGNLFTVPTSATLILENIIVDGAKASGFANGNGSLVRVSGGAFVMNAGAVLRDNVFSNSSGGGVYVNSGTFTMNGGSISGNTASSSGGGVYVNNGILTLGGTVAITDNFTSGGIASNVYLNDNQYISISSITPPATGMNIGITKTANRGVFVQSGAKVEHVQYFHEDVTGKESKFCGNALAIGVSIYCLVESYATAQTDVVIDVEEDLPLDWLATIPANNNGKTLTIRSAGPTVTLKRGIIGNLFTVSANAKLILENIIIDGAKDASSFANNAGALVRVNSGGVFTMNNGVILRNFCAGGVYVDGGVFTMTGGKISGNTVNCNQSTGVSVDNEGTFTMENGVISGNTASNGGGVYITNNSTFTMENGVISGNTASNGGGVYITNNSTFTMENGEISGNTVNGYAYGGGVYITNNSTFTMENGEISGNTAYFGGGVYIINNSTFTMENGEISGNTASNGGGGVYGYGTFTMSGGTISGNTAANGGGVNGTLTMNGGSISGNTAANGGGVYGTLTMNGGSISGNTASDGGGGVYGTFTMRGGEISNNKSAGVGGGVSGSFTMSGGVISGNTASIGGGVYNSGTFTMNGGSISGNTASSGGGVYNFGTFTMSDGTISGNTAGEGGGVYVYGNGAFTMTGGSISDNTASSGSGVYRYSGAVNLNGGIVVGTGTNATSVVFGNYNINQGVIVVWNKSADPFIYTESRNTHLTALPTGNATAIWAIDDDGKFGISYKNHDNEGFVEIADVIVKTVISGAIVSAPALVGKTYNTITINEVAVPASGQTVEYAVSTINSAPTDGWQTELVFAELASNTAYYIFARSQENIDYYAGIPLSPLITTTFSQNNWIDEADFSWYLSSQTEFTLTTAEQLAGLAYIVNEGHESFSGKRIILGSNISLNSTTGWQNWAIATSDYIKLWTPIGTSTNPFRGTFVGNGFKISGVYIDNANDNQGLFGVVNGGKIEKLGVVASYIKGNSNVGGLVGNGNTPIEYCYSMANVTGTSNIGGLIGNRGSGTITQSYATGNVIGTSNVGGLSGSGTGTVTQSYYNSETLGGGTNGFGRTTAEMKTQSSYIGWNFVTPIWKIDNNGVINDGYPYLREFKEVVTKPMLIANEFIYNALPRTVELNQANPAYTLTGDVTKTNAGNYTIAVTLSDPSRYEWADGTTTDIALSWSIAKAQIAKPTVTNTNLVYTGSAQSAGIVANTAYEVSNGTATNANSNYIASVTLKDKANHEWTDGTITDLSLPWSINLKNITITSAAALSKTYDGNESANAGAISFDGLANSEILILGTDYSISAEFTGGNYNAGDSKPYAYTVAIIPNAKTNNYNLSANAYNGTNGVINKANPTYTIPTNLTANYGDLLSDVKLPTGWSWQKTGTVGEVGMQTHKATFTPEDAKNYNAILDVELTITVNSIINTSQDNIDIAAAKATIESTEFGPIPQSILNTQGMARGFVEANLELNGVTYTVVNNSFIAAVAGTVSDIFGTNGLYTFTVKLNKGIGTEQEYVGQLVIVATKYEPPMQGEQCEDGEELVDGKCTTKTIGMVFAAQTIGILKIGESFSIQGLSKAETVRIVDVKGKILMSKTVMPNESVSIVHLPKGMYLVNVNGKTFRMAK